MSLAVVLGAGIVSFIFLWFSFQLESDNQFLRVLMVLFGFGMLFLVPAATIHQENNCYHEMVNSSVSYNDTYYYYDEFCYNHENGSKAFYSAQALAYSIMILYLLVYLFILALKALNNSAKKGGRR